METSRKIALLVVVAVAIGGIAVVLSISDGIIVPGHSYKVSAYALDVNGQYSGNVTWLVGQRMLFSVQVPGDSDPVSIQSYVNGAAQGTFSWDVTRTHYNYIIDYGVAGAQDLGKWQVYAVVTFGDGSKSKSNTVFIEVDPSG